MDIEAKPTLMKLTNENYFRWEYEMKNYLGAKELFKNCQFANFVEYWTELTDSLENMITASTTASTTTSTTTTTTIDLTKIDRKEIMKWNKDDEKCKSYLRMYVAEKFHEITKKEPITANQMWNELKRKCELTTNMNMLTMLREFQLMKMNDKETLLKYLERVELAVEKLKNVGKKFTEEETIIHVLSTLREEFATITMTIMLVPQSQLTLEFVAKQFALYESLNQRANAPTKRIGETLNSENRNESRTCFKCGVKGHIAKDCHTPQWKIEKFQKREEENDEKFQDEKKVTKDKRARIYHRPEGNSAEVLNAEKRKEEEPLEWILDTGANQHMINEEHWLTDKYSCHTKVASAFGETQSKRMIVGNVHLFCEKEIKLTNVLYVPNLRRNIISIPAICDKDERIKVEFSKEGMTIKRNQEVLMKGSRGVGGLYTLDQYVTSGGTEAHLIICSPERIGDFSLGNLKMANQALKKEDSRKINQTGHPETSCEVTFYEDQKERPLTNQPELVVENEDPENKIYDPDKEEKIDEYSHEDQSEEERLQVRDKIRGIFELPSGQKACRPGGITNTNAEDTYFVRFDEVENMKDEELKLIKVSSDTEALNSCSLKSIESQTWNERMNTLEKYPIKKHPIKSWKGGTRCRLTID